MKKIDLNVTIKKSFIAEKYRGDSQCEMCFFNSISHLMNKHCSDDNCKTYGYVWGVYTINESR